MSRACRPCASEGRRRSTPDDLAHVHELEEGDAFAPPDGDRQAREVVEIAPGRVVVSAGKSVGRTVQFQRRDGSAAEFEVSPTSDTESWAPTALVRPLNGGHPDG